MVVAAPLGIVLGFLGEFALDILFVAAILAAFGLAYWILENARGFALRLPLVSSLVVGAIDNIALLLVVTQNSFDSVIDAHVVQIARTLRNVLEYYIAPVMYTRDNAIHDLYGNVIKLWQLGIVTQNTVAYIINTYVHDLYGNVVQLWDRVKMTETNVSYIINTYVHDLYGNVVQLWSHVTAIETQAIPRLQANEVALANALAELQAYLPLLRQLAQFESRTQQGIAGLGTQEAALEQQGRVLGQQISTVLPLAGLAALGAVAIQNLVNVAEDPCFCLNQGGLSDLTDRVSALEEMGP